MIRLGEAMMILELHRQGLSVTAIARRTGRDPKTIRKYIERGVEVPLIILTGHCGLHAIVEDLDRHAAQRLEGLHVAAQQRLQVLMQHIAGEEEARVTQHQAIQPDDARHSRLVGKFDDKAGKVDLRLHARFVSKRSS